ncbi:MAG TPA: acyl-CoA dehydrogenase family protein [Chitinispirillaceae bacterium]|jgi:alkylation response protein AidB-like acyl-CoA dehydrogenase|nr:acyl-CoA dehydrogenase family protein [Chitinispirillaceae bacterium]
MNWFLTEEQQMIIDTAREIAQKKILPVREKYDHEGIFPWDVVEALSEVDLCGLYIPEEYGGFGGGVFELCLAVEELSKVCGGISLAMAATALGTFPILLFANEEQKKKYLPPIASGKKLAAFGLTEANAGSDAIGMMKTTAKLDGDHYVLNGTKQWITNGENAEIYTVLAITNPRRGARGVSAFIVEKGTPGFTFGKHEDKMGIRASSTTELVFQDCRIPKENLLGKEGMGAIITINTLNYSRPGVGSQALGIAAGALDDALAYSRQRVQFGAPVSSFQAVQHMLANMATEIEAARALLYATARTIDAGEKKFAKESAMSKLFCSDVAMKVTVDALQVMGGYGYMREYPMEKRMRDAKITQIYEGTNQIQRNEIALQLIKNAAS